MRTIKIVLSLARAAMRLSATTRKAAVLALAMFSGLAINALEPGYYLAGTMNGWAATEGYQLVQNPNNTNEFFIQNVILLNSGNLTAEAEFKVKVVNDDHTERYFDTTSGNICIEGGKYTVYFRPNGGGGDGWRDNGRIFINNDVSSYYLVGTFTSWGLDNSANYLLSASNDTQGEYYIFNVNLQKDSEFKVVKSPNGTDIVKWYGDNQTINSTSTYAIYFKPGGDNNWPNQYYYFEDLIVNWGVSAEGYATYYNSSYDVELPNKDIKAYIVTDVNGTTLTYNLIADNDNTTEQPNTVPAGTAILLKVATTDITEGKVDLTLKPKGTDNRTITGNKLYGSDSETTTSGDNYFYKLTYSDKNDNFGWYWGATGGVAFTSPAHKAWLALHTLPTLPSGTRAFLSLPGDDFTGIATIENRQQNADNVWYDLNGRRINAPTTKGIYVKDGRKFVIK